MRLIQRTFAWGVVALALLNGGAIASPFTITFGNGPSVPFVVNENVLTLSQGTTPGGLTSGPGTAVACSSQNQQY